MHITQLREQEIELSHRNAKVVLITFENNPLAQDYAQATTLPWPLLIDEKRELYKHYGMRSASFWEVWNFKTMMLYFKELAKGQRLQKTAGNIYQQGGDVLIDPGGIVRLHYVGKGPADRPTTEMILRTIGK